MNLESIHGGRMDVASKHVTFRFQNFVGRVDGGRMDGWMDIARLQYLDFKFKKHCILNVANVDVFLSFFRNRFLLGRGKHNQNLLHILHKIIG